MVKDVVLSFLKINGPSLPVDIGKAIGRDSFWTRAILLELRNDGLVKMSNRAIGSSLIYYLPEQANKMRELLSKELKINEQKVLDRFKELGQFKMSELSPHERAFVRDLLDFINVKRSGEDYLITHYEWTPRETPVSAPTPEPIKEPEITPLNRELRLFDNTPIVKKEAAKKGFIDKAHEYLESIGEITKSVKIKAGAEYDYELRVKNPYPQELLVKVKNKKNINETDLSVLYAESLRQKRPALLITNGSLSKKAKEWKDNNIGGLVTIIQLK
ncbi:MAG: hypothetical protein WC307_01645 [Candidatus Nanoarchaeia archaeon]